MLTNWLVIQYSTNMRQHYCKPSVKSKAHRVNSECWQAKKKLKGLMNSWWIRLTRVLSCISKSIEWFLYKKSRKCVADTSSWSVAQILLPPTVFLIFLRPTTFLLSSFPFSLFSLNCERLLLCTSFTVDLQRAERESFTFSGKILPLSSEKGWSVFLTASFWLKSVFSLR